MGLGRKGGPSPRLSSLGPGEQPCSTGPSRLLLTRTVAGTRRVFLPWARSGWAFQSLLGAAPPGCGLGEERSWPSLASGKPARRFSLVDDE